jgi:hypothetical protein
MNGIELTRFDQNAIVLSLFCAVALVRERRILPFAMVLAGAFFQGPLVSCWLAALVIWHRMDLGCRRWIQVRDLAGFFFILAGSIASDPGRAFFSLIGVVLISVNFGGGALGTLPAFLFLRQYHPAPEFLEVALVGQGLYWVLAEVSRWTEIPRGHQVLSWAELVGSILVLASFRAEVEELIGNPELVAVSTIILMALLGMSVWIRLRPEGFLSFCRRIRPKPDGFIFWGGRLISGEEPWSRRFLPSPSLEIENGLERLFWWLLGLTILAGLSVAFLGGVF